ncbi:MAG: PEP-CTERM sorting domain-containing protein [Phycisphaerae bacterium]
MIRKKQPEVTKAALRAQSKITWYRKAAICGTVPLISLSAVPAKAGLVSISKTETLTLPGAPTGGFALVGAIADSQTVQKINFPAATRFTPNGAGNSLNTVTAQATVGDYAGTATAAVGAFTQIAGRLQATATLTASSSFPDTPPPLGGFAVGFSRVVIRGTITPTSLTNQNDITVTNPGLIKKIEDATSGAKVYDPITVSMTDQNTGETITSAVYSNIFESQDGGTVGFNTNGNLELAIGAGAPTGEVAQFDSSTDASYATNLTGAASLQGGTLAVSGIFGNLADWTLTHDPKNPNYVTDAVFNNSSELDQINIALPEFTNLSTSPTDTVNLSVDLSMKVSEANAATPEPAALALMGIGGAAILLIRRRHTPLSRRNI